MRRLAHRPDDLFVAGVADQEHVVALGCVPACLHVHLRHERARRVDRVQPALRRPPVHLRRDAVCRQHQRRSRRRVVLVLDEDGAALLEVAHDMQVVDDLLADVDRRSVQGQRALDRLDGTLYSRTVTPG